MGSSAEPNGAIIDAGPSYRRYECVECGHRWSPQLSAAGWADLKKREDRIEHYLPAYCPECQAEDAQPLTDTRATFTDGPLLARIQGRAS